MSADPLDDQMPRQLREYRLEFVPGARLPDPDGDDLGLRSKLGGTPEWDQDDEQPSCSSCREPMTFVGQLDSFEHDSEKNPHRVDCLSGDQDFMFGDVGLIYVFFCFECSEPKAVFQCG